MNFKENIKYREYLDHKVHLGEKLNQDEKEWGKLNPTFNPKYEEAYYQSDVIDIRPNSEYEFTLEVEHLKDGYYIVPAFSGVSNKDRFTCDAESDFKKPARAITITTNDRFSFAYKSNSGKMKVQYILMN